MTVCLLILLLLGTLPSLASSYKPPQPSASWPPRDKKDAPNAGLSPRESSASTTTAGIVRSVNYHISRECNYKCQFCFHTQKNKSKLGLGRAMLGLQLLRQAGCEKVNFAGGEPFLHPDLLGKLCQEAHELGMAVSIISNGSLIRKDWIEQYGAFVDVLGTSIDSFNPETNDKIGRISDANKMHVDRVFRLRELCREHGILFKMNTVVCRHNWKEDMSALVRELDPHRWKVFQVLVLDGENSGQNGDLRNGRDLQVSPQQFDVFCEHHKAGLSTQQQQRSMLVPEPNDLMQNSYLILDEEMRFLDCSQGGKVPSQSILTVGVEAALAQAGFDQEMFHERGGVYQWTRDRGD